MGYQQASTDFTTPARLIPRDMANTNFTGTFPRMKEKKSCALTAVKSASTWSLSEQDQHTAPSKRGSFRISTGADFDRDTLKTFGVSENTLNRILPSLEQSWKDVLSNNNGGVNSDGEDTSSGMTARNVLNETLRNCSATNTLIKKKLALALEIQNVMYSIG